MVQVVQVAKGDEPGGALLVVAAMEAEGTEVEAAVAEATVAARMVEVDTMAAAEEAVEVVVNQVGEVVMQGAQAAAVAVDLGGEASATEAKALVEGLPGVEALVGAAKAVAESVAAERGRVMMAAVEIQVRMAAVAVGGAHPPEGEVAGLVVDTKAEGQPEVANLAEVAMEGAEAGVAAMEGAASEGAGVLVEEETVQ